jgi:hypothetical protein
MPVMTFVPLARAAFAFVVLAAGSAMGQQTSSEAKPEPRSMFLKLAPPATGLAPIDSRLVIVTEQETVAVDPRTLDQTATPGGHRRAVRNPDGTRELFLAKAEETGKAWDLFAGGVGSQNPTRLTTNLSSITDPSWSPDQTSVTFFAGDRGARAAYRVRLNGIAGPTRPEKLDLPAGTFILRSGGAEQLAYAVETRREGKSRFCDVIVSTKEVPKTLVSGEQVFDLAISPQGDRLAVGTLGSLLVFDIASGRRTEFRCDSWDGRLNNHAPHDLAWSPAGDQIACSSTFVGGRFGDGQAMPVIYGDREVFIITGADGSARAISRPADVLDVFWVRGTLDFPGAQPAADSKDSAKPAATSSPAGG